MNDITHVPYAQPVMVPVTPIPSVGLVPPPPPPGALHGAVVRRRTEGFAVASAICGFTAIVPLVSQVIGLAFGVVGLLRIRRARRQGVELGGTKWAVFGIFSSGFVLVCWMVVYVVLSQVNSLFSRSAQSLSQVLPGTGF